MVLNSLLNNLIDDSMRNILCLNVGNFNNLNNVSVFLYLLNNDLFNINIFLDILYSVFDFINIDDGWINNSLLMSNNSIDINGSV